MQSPEFFELFISPLERSGIDYFVTGSVATIVYGDPRLTHDIDVVVHMKSQQVHSFINSFPEKEYYCPPEDVIQIELKRENNGHFNLIHHDSGMKADIYPDRPDQFYQWAFKNRRKIEILPGTNVWVAPPEYVITRKLEFYREGRSEKHLKDIASVLTVSKDTINMEFLSEQVSVRELEKYWKQALALAN